MIKTIVVPVDRTRGEETKAALNIGAWLSLLFGSRLLLLGLSSHEPRMMKELHPAHGDVIPIESPDIFREHFDELWEYPLFFPQATGEPVEEVAFNSEQEQKLETYLSGLQKELTGSHPHHKLPPGRVSQRIANGPLEEALKELHATEPIGLVVLPAHHDNALRSLLFSSQSNQILREDQLPVLVVPAGFKVASLKQFENETLLVNLKLFLKPTKGHILVTLDGSAQAEAALPLAAELAEKMKVSLYLLLVLPLDPHKEYFDHETAQTYKLPADPLEHYDYAYKYLCHIQQGLIDRGINCHRLILQGKAEQRIVRFIEKTRPMLTILATHAYPKLGQILLGSVAEKLIKDSSRLVLLVPPNFQAEPEAVAVEKPDERAEKEEMAGSPG